MEWNDWDSDGEKNEIRKWFFGEIEDLSLLVFDSNKDGNITLEEVVIKLAQLGYMVNKK